MGKPRLVIASLLLLPGTILPRAALARPEYAVREKVSCTSCHVTPWGGGPRTVFGKTYGAHGQGPGLTAGTDLFYADIRAIAFAPIGDRERSKQTPHGVALMEAAAAANVPLLSGNPEELELRAVGNYDFSPLSGSGYLRDTYLRFKLAQGTLSDETHVTLGRLYLPFGLLTDEHRTYTRIVSRSQINLFTTGGAISLDWHSGWHVDLAVGNDLQTSGGFVTGDHAAVAATTVRWIPPQVPVLLGASANYQYSSTYEDPRAISGFGVLSLDRLTNKAISGTLSYEAVEQWQWTQPALSPTQVTGGVGEFFGPEFVNSRSMVHYLWARYQPVESWTLIYKLDAWHGFTRHGLGFETYFKPSIVLSVRGEKANSPDNSNPNAPAAQDDVFAMVRISL